MRTRTPRPFGLIAWPFRSTLTSPLWLGLRIYLASVWLQFGVGKIRGGWLDGDALGALLQAVADGQTPAPFPFYEPVAAVLLAVGADVALSILIPLAEVAIATAFLTGVLLVPAAIGAILINANLILAGIASVNFDGRIIALQVLLLLAWRVAGFLGLGTLLAGRWNGHGPLPRAV